MKPDPQLNSLHLQHKELLHGLCLPDTLLHRDTPPALQKLDLHTARRLVGAQQPWGAEDVFSESARLVTEVFLGSDAGRRIYLTGEIDLLQRLRETKSDLLHHGPFEVLEFVLPVKVRGYHVHLVRSGKFRSEPFRAQDIQELAFTTGVPAKAVEAAVATLPVIPASALDAWQNLLRRQRDLVAGAMEALLSAGSAVSPETDRLAALGSMAEGMAHHFSNLLSVILGYSSLVLAKSELSAEDREALQKVAEAAQQGRRFTEEVLTLAGTQEQADALCGVHERLQRAIGLLQARAGIRVEVDIRFDAARDTVAAPPGLVHQMALNLLGNAFDSLPEGGRVSVHTSNAPGAAHLRIEVTEEPSAPMAGDSDAALPATERPALARLLGQVARLDGEVSSQDAARSDHRVVVTLPVVTPDQHTAPQKKIRRRLAPSAIWVVDDDPVVREMCRRVLVADGHSVEESASGADVQNKLAGQSTKPDLIIYDFSMPDVDGIELASWMRENGYRTPIILVSGLGPDHPSLKKTAQLRKTFVLQKPFSFRDMVDIVTIAMGETLVEG